MKKTILYSTFLFFGWVSAQEINKTIEYKPNKLMLLGKVNKNGFKHKDFTWFNKNYTEYLANNKIVKQIQENINDYKIKVFFGSWCGDSRKNIPPFLKILDKVNFNNKNLEIIALDRKKEVYKQSPKREEKDLNIHRVPTFIFYKNGKEINRIVEHPKETLERDILKIINNRKYQPNYSGVSFVEKLLTESSLDSISLIEERLIAFLPEITKGTSELNTYGNVKWRANELEKAEFIFKLNTKLYPLNHYTYKSLADFYFDQKKYQKALKLYYKSLSINTKNTKIKERISEIETLTLNP